MDGLTDTVDDNQGRLELRPEDVAANDAIKPDTTMPVAALDSNQLDVYGWEPSLWKKVRGYLGI